MSVDLTKYKIHNMKNKTFYQDEHLQIFDFQRKDGKKIKRDEMKHLCNAIQTSLQKRYDNGIISISIKYPNRWYSSDTSYLNEDIQYFTANDYDEFDEDPDEYEKIRFHFIPFPKSTGGKDEHNDCLIKCIKKCVQTFKSLIDAEELKTILGIERDDKIPIDMMPEVEAYINNQTRQTYSIFVSGDYTYNSPIKTNKRINLILSNEHYTINENDKTKVKGKAYKEKPILMTEIIDDVVYSYDGEEEGTLTREEYNDYNKNVLSSPFTITDKLYINTKETRKLSIEESYNNYIKMADELKARTYGKINFYKCGSVKQNALNYFFELTKAIQPDDINNNEASWIENASMGALTYWERYVGKVHAYDINSHYPNIMSKNYNCFPIKEGEYKIIGEIAAKPEYGIYRCEIKRKAEAICKFFRFNRKNTYTHLDIEMARDYGLEIKLIQDGKPNFLYYSKDKLMNGNFLFKHYVSEFYELKKNGVQGAKALLNILWGALCEANTYKYNADSNDELHIKDADIKHLYSNDKIRIKCIYYNAKHYKTNYARIKPFVIGYGRRFLMKIFRKYEPLIVRIHTDGFYMTEQPDDILTGDKLGNLKYEGERMVNIQHLNKVK